MKKIYIGTLILAMMFVLSGSVLAAEEHDFDGVRELIDNETPCAQLSDEQLEAVGDYYMEQIHPGDNHNVMDEMMGGEGSESLRQAHIFMAKRWYCGDSAGMGMMGMMMGSGVFGSSMFNSANKFDKTKMDTVTGISNYGMHGFGLGSFWITKILIWILLILGIASFVKYLSKK